MRDLLVAGGGPAGLATAIEAAQQGLSVQVLEPRAGTIDKACGEGLMPAAVRGLERLGVAIPHSHPFRGIRYVHGDDAVSGDFSAGPGLGVRRTVLHAALRERALSLGVELTPHRARDLRQLGDCVEVDGHRGRYLVAADGLHSPIRQGLGLNRPARRPRRLGIRRHFAMRPWSDQVEVHWADDAEAYVTPVDDELVGIAVLYRADSRRPAAPGEAPPFERLLARFPELQQRLVQPCTQARGAGPFEQNVARRTAGRVLLVGDAAGYLDPITGEGIRLALETAEAAVHAVSTDTVESYEAAWWRITRRYRWMTGGLLWVAAAPWRRRLILPTLRRAPGLLRFSIDQLGS